MVIVIRYTQPVMRQSIYKKGLIMVYVISKDNKPLMPCENVVARLLLKQGKAKCIKRTPFTIKLLYKTTEYTQDLILGIDTGSRKVGSAVVNNKNEVIYVSEVEIRNDITDKMILPTLESLTNKDQGSRRASAATAE